MKEQEMSITQLKNAIREKTKRINTLLKVNKDLQENFAVTQTVRKLQHTGARGKSGNLIGLGLSKKRSKESLVRQLRELNYAEPLLSSNKGMEMLDDKYKTARDSFLSSAEFNDMDDTQWRDIVETFGALGKEIVEQFDSTSIANQFSDKTVDIDMVELMKKTLNENKGMGLTKDELTQAFIDKLSELIK